MGRFLPVLAVLALEGLQRAVTGIYGSSPCRSTDATKGKISQIHEIC